MSTTYHFVKVAAGEPFPFETGNHSLFIEPSIDYTANIVHCTKDEVVSPRVTWYLLRPVEPAADGGREGWETKVRYAAVDCANKMFDEGSDKDLSAPMQAFEKGAQFALQNQPAPVDNVALLEWVAVEQWEYRGEGKWIQNKMTRPIKFRAWQKHHNKMHYNVNLYQMGNREVCRAQLDNKTFMDTVDLTCILMQFTGLHDKKGKEIYEGDICQIMMRKKYGHQSEGLATVGAVEFGAVYVREDTLYAFDTFHIDSRSIRYLLGHDLEVIGNIYEHSHLLTPTP